MKHKTILFGLLAGLCVIVLMATLRTRTEGFTNAPTGKEPPECPKTAKRSPDGRIVIMPGNKKFNTMAEYVNYLAGLYADGATCIPPLVEQNRPTIPGILGGLGNGVEPPSASNQQTATRTVLDYKNLNEQTSAKTPINKLDDYEYSRIFQSEKQGRNFTSREEGNKTIGEHVLDWANLPFNSEDRANKEDSFIAGRMESGFRDPKTGILFKDMEGSTVMPPDVEAARLEEQKALASYRPTQPGQHIIDSETEAVARLVNKMYAGDPNWEPVIQKTGDNAWSIAELRPKTRREKWEDVQTVDNVLKENTTIANPKPDIDIDDRLQGDPYFDKGGRTDMGDKKFWNYNDFRQWTPGLERMFAPTGETRAWY
jgi:hypothetical protein